MSAIRDAGLAAVEHLARQIHPQATVREARGRATPWGLAPREGWRVEVGRHELAVGTTLAELTTALETLRARPAADPTDERLPLP